MPNFNDLLNEVINDVINKWKAASLAILSYNRVQTKLKDLVTKFERSKKRAKVSKRGATRTSRIG